MKGEIMNIDIRKSIKDNFNDADISEIKASIESSIEESQEITLPGLGVFFEILWKNSDIDLKEVIIKNIQLGLNNN
ncbi:MAG: small acid-soluble spore protein SspI [Firmicutes bacterium]|nr:small acid-soluble spore protein SspI [Bacillota bacterium]